ncbi:MAG: universal stress protein [Nitrososphaerota archaeon]|nr:universal stress protein [Candidatus Bathyarchaeota archaeon]MDW8022994.1 universal stress protein [Nitrososphaerota archaeon]
MGETLFEKILVPLDGSEHSFKALEIAVQIAKKFGGKITLIHVYQVSVRPMVMPEPITLTPGIPIISPGEYSKVVEAARDAGSRILAEGEKKAKAEGVEVETLLREGHTVHEIVRAAGEGKFNLIIMGARGISRIKEIILGSVSDGVIRNAPCPVLITK